jgi:1-phosphofructokinase/tagatose 6-phosphate kinase
MIRVIGANPAMDRSGLWAPLRLSAVNRAREVHVAPGGKGFNVARAVIRLGRPVAAHGFLGGHVGEALREMILADGVEDRHTTIAAGTRVCFIVVEPEAGRTTVLNEPGPVVTPEETQRFLDDLRADITADDLVVLSGSLPDSVPAEVAGEIVAIGTAAGARTVVDIHSQALREVVARGPWTLKCNQHELQGLLDLPEAADPLPLPVLAAEMQQLRRQGIETVVVTMGAGGALLAADDDVVHARVPVIDEVNPTGSGDLLLAGLVVGLERGWPAQRALALGAACGTAGATHLAPELPAGFDEAAWVDRIVVAPVAPAA